MLPNIIQGKDLCFEEYTHNSLVVVLRRRRRMKKASFAFTERRTECTKDNGKRGEVALQWQTMGDHGLLQVRLPKKHGGEGVFCARWGPEAGLAPTTLHAQVLPDNACSYLFCFLCL